MEKFSFRGCVFDPPSGGGEAAPVWGTWRASFEEASNDLDALKQSYGGYHPVYLVEVALADKVS